MKTAFEHFVAGPPAPSRPVPSAPDGEAQHRWEDEGGNNEIRQPAAAAPAYASYASPWRARFGTPAPYARAMPI